MPVNEIAQLEEDMRREKLRAWGQRLLPVVVMLALAIILGVAIRAGLHSWKTSNQEEFTADFARILDESDDAKRTAALNTLAQEYPKAAAAKLAMLSEKLVKTTPDDAIHAVTQVSQDKDLPVFYRQMMVILAARYALDADAATSRAVLADLAPIAGDSQSSWQAQAVFYTAVIRMRQAEDVKEIRDIATGAEKILARDPALLKQLHQLETLYISDRPVA
ncbi:MAG: hypothetical protein V4621_01050 [Pseudomonadota bacterium]